MVSRDTTVHVGALLLTFVVLAVVEYADTGAGGDLASVPVFLLFYGLALGGAHFYLALRGEDGMVPVESRWRYVGMLAVLLGAGAVTIYAGDRSIAAVELESIATAIAVVAVIVYFLAESTAGYRASRSG